MKMESKSNFKVYIEKEKKIKGEVEENEKQRKIIDEKRKNTEKLKYFQERRKKIEQEISNLEKKFPILKKMKKQKYIDFLQGEVKTREGVRLAKGLKISPEDGSVSCGQVAEDDLLGRVYIRKSDRVLSPKRNHEGGNEIIKELAFTALIEFYKIYQKEEECKLGKHVREKLQRIIESSLGDESIKIQDIQFFTGVGTTLDFNYGVDS